MTEISPIVVQALRMPARTMEWSSTMTTVVMGHLWVAQCQPGSGETNEPGGLVIIITLFSGRVKNP